MAIYSLRARADFVRLRHGASYSAKNFKLHYTAGILPTKAMPLAPDQVIGIDVYVGYTVTKKLFKKAVDRNRIKRRLRSLSLYLYTQLAHAAETSHHPISVNFLARPGALTTCFEELKRDIDGFIAFYRKTKPT